MDKDEIILLKRALGLAAHLYIITLALVFLGFFHAIRSLEVDVVTSSLIAIFLTVLTWIVAKKWTSRVRKL